MKTYILKFKNKLIKYIIITILFVAANAYYPLVIGQLTDLAISKNLNLFLNKTVIAFIAISLSLILEYYRRVSLCDFEKECSICIKEDLFKSLMQKNHSSYSNVNSSNYTSMMLNDMNLIKDDYLGTVTGVILTIIQLIIYGYAIFMLNFYIAICLIIFSILPLFIPSFTEKELAKRKKQQSDKLSSFTVKTRDMFSGFEVIKSFNIFERMFKEFNNVNRESEEAEFYYYQYSTKTNIITGFCVNINFFVTLILGAYLILKGSITIGTYIAIINIMQNVSSPIRDIAYTLMNFKSIKPVESKLMEIINNKDIKELGEDKDVFLSNISYDNVSFSYGNGEYVLRDIDLRIDKGYKYAIVGESGSGKSTLLKLVLKYYENFNGKITIDGEDIKDIKASSIQSMISVIQQNIFLFDATIEENMCLFSEVSTKEIEKALESSQLTDFKDKLDLNIGENGSSISGGEKQRISIARAIIKQSPILMLDEATSSLDNETAYKIEKCILNMNDITSLVITHRLSEDTLRLYDKIIVMKNGKVVGNDSFDNLMEQKGYFYKLYSISNND